MRPLLSVCVPTYNRALILRKTIENILEVDSNDFELVISDNASTDSTSDVLSSFEDYRLRYYKNETNMGFVFNLIRVLEISNGHYSMLLSDEDDIEIFNVLNVLKSFKNIDPLVIKGNFIDFFSESVSSNYNLFAFKFGYMSGILFKRDEIDFSDLKSEFRKYGHGYLQFHPHIYLTNQLMNKGPVLSTKTEFFRLRDRGEDYMDTINNYRCDELISWFDQTRTNLDYIISNPNLDENTKMSLSLSLYRGFLYYASFESKQIPLNYDSNEDYRYRLKLQIKKIIRVFFPTKKSILFKLIFAELIVTIKTNFPKCYSLIINMRIQFSTLISNLRRNINLTL